MNRYMFLFSGDFMKKAWYHQSLTGKNILVFIFYAQKPLQIKNHRLTWKFDLHLTRILIISLICFDLFYFTLLTTNLTRETSDQADPSNLTFIHRVIHSQR